MIYSVTQTDGLLFTHHKNPPKMDPKIAIRRPNEYFLGFSSGGLSGNF